MISSPEIIEVPKTPEELHPFLRRLEGRLPTVAVAELADAADGLDTEATSGTGPARILTHQFRLKIAGMVREAGLEPEFGDDYGHRKITLPLSL